MSFKLFGVNAIENLDRTEIARRELRNLLTSYADEADLFNEILQNALDSVLTALHDGVYTEQESPEIAIGIGRRRNSYQYLYVGDNGLGMERNTAFNLTVPGFSSAKNRGSTLGYKGVGASYFSLQATEFRFIPYRSRAKKLRTPHVGATLGSQTQKNLNQSSRKNSTALIQ